MKAKRIIAASLAATMVLGTATSVFADETSANGNSVVENDNSTAPNVKNIVLPTLNPTTYDFVIDRDNLLSQFDAEGKYDGSTVYFNRVAEAARIDAKAGDELITVYEKVKEVAAAGDLLALFSGKKLSEIGTINSSGYYVWVPDTVTNTEKNSGAGDWEEVTGTNLTNYFVLYNADGAEIVNGDANSTIAGIEVRPDFNYGSNVFDGNVYADVYAEVTPEDLVDKVTIDEHDAITAANGLYKVSSDAYVAVSTSDLTYVPAVTSYTAKSDDAVITNKGTKPVMVDATVTIVNTDGLTFSAAEDSLTNTNANVFFSLIGGENSTAVKKTGTVAITGSTTLNTVEGSASMLIPAADTTINKYQGAAPVSGTGSHNYYQYLGPYADYYSASFAITGEVDTTDSPETNAAWANYISKLESGEYVKPSVQVVYTVNEAEEVVDSEGNVTGYKVYAKATNDGLEALQAKVDVAQAEVAKVQNAYDTAYKNYLEKKEDDDAAAADVAEAQQALDVANAKLAEAVDLGLCKKTGGTDVAANVGEVAADDPYKVAVTTAETALADAQKARLTDDSGDAVADVSTYDTYDPDDNFTGTYRDLVKNKAALDTAKATLTSVKGKLTTAQGALDGAKTTAGTAVTTILYDNTKDEAVGDGSSTQTIKHYWE